MLHFYDVGVNQDEDVSRFFDLDLWKACRESLEKAVKDKEVCCLCLQYFAVGEEVKCIWPCKHIMHDLCIEGRHTQLARDEQGFPTCPVCRERIDHYEILSVEKEIANADIPPEGNPKEGQPASTSHSATTKSQ